MKKLLFIVLLIPILVFAKTESYEKMDIIIELNPGTAVGDVKYQIFASTNDDDKLVDRTSEFSSELSIYRINNDGFKETLISTYELKEDEVYGFIVSNIIPENEATINVDDSSEVLINSKEENVKVSLNDGVLSIDYSMPKKEEDKKEPEVIEEKTILPEKDSSCLLGLSLCCKEYKGISYCIICVCGIVFVIVLIAIISAIIDKRDDKKYKDF